jgi:hypothetical protein
VLRVSTEFRVRFPNALASDGELVHRIRNFAEDLQRSLSKALVGTVETVDTVTNTVLVRVGSTRMIGQATAAAKAQLKRHNLLADAVLER